MTPPRKRIPRAAKNTSRRFRLLLGSPELRRLRRQAALARWKGGLPYMRLRSRNVDAFTVPVSVQREASEALVFGQGWDNHGG